MARNRLLVIVSVMLAALSLLTGCKSSRGSVRGGSGQASAVGSFSLEDYAKTITDPMAKALINEARGWIGTKYQYGGDSKSGTDCSGLVMRLYGNVCGVKIPRSTREQVRFCTKVARNKMRPGDLVFFAPEKSDDKVSHVGLYIGEGRMIHASSSRGVMVSGFDSGYWGDRYFTGARVDKASRAFASSGKGKKETQSLPPPPPGVSPAMPEVVLPPASAAPELQGMPAIPDIPALPVSEGDLPGTTSEVSADAPVPSSTIDLLDLIINQKVDSIFTSKFTD